MGEREGRPGNTTGGEQTGSGEKTNAQNRAESEHWVDLGEFP